jgi:hypothetical protein
VGLFWRARNLFVPSFTNELTRAPARPAMFCRRPIPLRAGLLSFSRGRDGRAQPRDRPAVTARARPVFHRATLEPTSSRPASESRVNSMFDKYGNERGPRFCDVLKKAGPRFE